uniref:G_PROTEIN_RECEP_F1_2 domain-containing protein n=1 Tax=Toxocara canis TaxID=6265 RepID=A0A183TV38_TOXCA
LLNSLAYFTARKVQPTRSVMLQLRKIRYILVLDLLSCVLVALPNTVSLIAVFVGRLPMSISEPADWLSSINSSINFFVYYVMNNEFKRRVDTVCCVRSKVVSLSQ